MWPFSRQPQPQPEPVEAKPIRTRLDDLEDAVEHLGRRFTRLQQQVTRWSREFDEDLEQNDDEPDDDVLETINDRRRSG